MDNKFPLIPTEVLKALLTNHSGKKRRLTEGLPIKIQQKTKDALNQLKAESGMSSMSNTIDYMITTIAAYQYNDKNIDWNDIPENCNLMAADLSKGGVVRGCIINGREFYAIEAVAKHYRITRQTVMNRIANVKNPRFRHWNYIDDDIESKYRKDK